MGHLRSPHCQIVRALRTVTVNSQIPTPTSDRDGAQEGGSPQIRGSLRAGPEQPEGAA